MSELNTRPLGDRVIIKEAPKEATTTSFGFILPEIADKPRIGEVIAIGPGFDDEPTTTPVGSKVVFSKYGGNIVTLEGVDYVLAKEDIIHAIIS